jgi:hypothetical protein
MLSPEQLPDDWDVLRALRPDCWVSVRALAHYLLEPMTILALGMPENHEALRDLLAYLRGLLEVLRAHGLTERRLDEWGCINTWEYTITAAGRRALEELAHG